MASKKGIAATVGVLAAITAASFAIWLVPEGGRGATVMISDHEANIARIADIHGTISAEAFGALERIGSEADAEAYAEGARASAVLIRAEVSQIVRLGDTGEFAERYDALARSLVLLDEFVTETIVEAGRAGGGGEADWERLRGMHATSAELLGSASGGAQQAQ